MGVRITKSEITEREFMHLNKARDVASECLVLLKNNGALPLKRMDIALYGSGARRTIKGGTGSGDVNTRFFVNVEDGLRSAGYSIYTKSWLDKYDAVCIEAQKEYAARFEELKGQNKQAAIMYTFDNPYFDPDVIEVSPEDIATETDTAIVVISRNSGEGKDRTTAKGDYELTDNETDMINTVCGAYATVIVVLNVGGVVNVTSLQDNPSVSAIILMSQLGQESGDALADVISGKVTPSGHLTTTWTREYKDYPSADTFAGQNGNVDDEYYNEDIYVGYRYFDSFGIEPLYPFGYGLSYTDFDVEVEKFRIYDEKVEMILSVTNIGRKYNGAYVAQCYYEPPKSGLNKPLLELATFKKTCILSPGKREQLTLSFPLQHMASYDESRAVWVLEKGVYNIHLGEHSRQTEIIAQIVLQEDIITDQLRNLCALDAKLESIKAELPNTKEQGQVYYLHEEEYTTRTHSYDISRDVSSVIKAASNEDLARMCTGLYTDGGESAQIGSAGIKVPGAAGETVVLPFDDREPLVLADGPAGLRLSTEFKVDDNDIVVPGSESSALASPFTMDEGPSDTKNTIGTTCYQYCTAIPIATALAQSWSESTIQQAGDIVGAEMELFGVDIWLAPAMNIHRNPLCGRNFEYYSEDPLLSGKCAAAMIKGVQNHDGRGCTIKHFAVNNQEDNRMHTNAHVSERALREIYLRGFEIAIRESSPRAIMTSYNLLNGIHTANNYELLNMIARCEWGFEGFIMTDWGTTGHLMPASNEYKYGDSDSALCIASGNDLIMPGSQEDVNDILAGLADGRLSREQLEIAADRIR